MPRFPYSKEPVVGKATVAPRGRTWQVFIYDYVGSNGSSSYSPTDFYFYTREEALRKAAELNDQQAMFAEKVYRSRQNTPFEYAYHPEPWEHIWLHEDKMYFFIWDTRELTRIAKNPFQGRENLIGSMLNLAIDNGKPISKNGRWLYLSELVSMKIDFKPNPGRK